MGRYEPDFETFEKVLRGQVEPQRVHFVELGMDVEVAQVLLGGRSLSAAEDSPGGYYVPIMELYRQLGYDCITVGTPWKNMPDMKRRVGQDTAQLSKGKRIWMEEGRGAITSWDDFERFPWDDIKPDFSVLECLEHKLPGGMKVMANGTVYEMVANDFLGQEGLFYLLYDAPDLVKAVFERWGEKVYAYYADAIRHESVGGIFHCDDLGYKTGTALSPDHLRTLLFPWLRKYVQLAHEQGKMCWLHSCGNLAEVMDELIDDVGFDAFHSFQDVIIPVADFKKRYGNKIAALGGVDVDRLARLSEAEVRKYVRKILDDCMPGGRYALGTGNSMANYIPVGNYLAMLDEGAKWEPLSAPGRDDT